MHVEKHIGELLFEHDCVIVPDFGGFVCNYSSSGINSSKHQFKPPFKKISFNRNLKNNDGLLANQISRSEGISYTDSNCLIAEYVEGLRKDLNYTKHFNFSNIGTFYIGEENTLLFEQDETMNYLPDSFGFSTFHSPAIKREPIERKIEKKLKDKIIIPSKEQTAIVPAKRRISRTLLASAAVVLITVLLWVPFQSGLVKNIDYSSLNPFRPSPKPLYRPSDIAQPDPDKNTIRPDVTNLPAMAGKDTARYLNIVLDGRIPIVVRLKDEFTPAARTTKKEAKTKNHFHIVGGAFAISENAEKFLKKLVKDGYEANIIDKKGKRLRFVSYGGFSTKEDALQALEKIRAVQGDVWLMQM
ncbi:MAG: SPOR domain-containing protein [Bacteroidetes bacterium]|nr:MAG: SPOR domain-containing protein [Bacteroidota bacterium]